MPIFEILIKEDWLIYAWSASSGTLRIAVQEQISNNKKKEKARADATVLCHPTVASKIIKYN